MTETLDSEVICIVHNIPKTFHARDLRNYFSQFLEKGCFICFHYRHRPEVQETASSAEHSCADQTSAIVAEAASDTAEPGTGSQSGPSGGGSSGGRVHRRSHVACCATLKLPRRHLAEFLSLYDRKHWVDSGGSYLSRRCFISRLRLPTASAGGPSPAAAELQSMIEFRPPADMPRGNVGTPTAHFLAEIQKCHLPASLVKRLGLVFPRSARRRQYSSVPLDYGTAPASSEDEREPEDEQVRTAGGAELLHRLPARPGAAAAAEGQAAEPPRASDETAAEETDRYEALHDDVTSQERTKERLYEEEIELVWEKGGPGLVWYTDAVYWGQQRGDFDERTADDWDVDMSGYEPGAGPVDMDARESRSMRRELRLRAGEETESAFERRRDRRARGHRGSGSDSDGETAEIGAFERHTRGFGRRVLLNLGWSEGRGLGAEERGIAEPVPNTGQTDRRGFGFVGERLERRPERKRRPESAAGRITTAFSDPRETELEEATDTTLPPTHMKFRRQQL